MTAALIVYDPDGNEYTVRYDDGDPMMAVLLASGNRINVRRQSATPYLSIAVYGEGERVIARLMLGVSQDRHMRVQYINGDWCDLRRANLRALTETQLYRLRQAGKGRLKTPAGSRHYRSLSDAERRQAAYWRELVAANIGESELTAWLARHDP